MKAVISLLAIVALAVVASLAFMCAAVNPDGEVAMHVLGDRSPQFRTVCILAGIIAMVLDLLLVWMVRRQGLHQGRGSTA